MSAVILREGMSVRLCEPKCCWGEFSFINKYRIWGIKARLI